MTKPAGYSIYDYGGMINNSPRMDAYAAALRHAVQPGMVVLDIGAGAGICSFLACQYGARHVYAIEPDQSIHLAREIAAENGMADRITFIEDISTQVTLPERADVMISDLHGTLPLFEQHIPSIVDARARLLKPGGTQIGLRDVMYVAPVESPSRYNDLAEPWLSGYAGLAMKAGCQHALNGWKQANIKQRDLLSSSQVWATLDYTSITEPDVEGELHWRAERDGILHGLTVWFDAVLAEGIGFSNAPDAPETVYRRALFPLLQPVHVLAGDTITMALQANLTSHDYTWSWNTTVWDQSEPAVIKARFRQSTFYNAPLSLGMLRKHSSHFVPALREDSIVDRAFLTMVDSQLSLGDIASQLLQRFPKRFTAFSDALTYAGDMADQYCAD